MRSSTRAPLQRRDGLDPGAERRDAAVSDTAGVDDDLVRVTLVDSEPAAELAVSMLQAEDIHAMWRGNLSSAAFGVGTSGSIEVLVRAEDAERASELLNAQDDTMV